MPEPIDSPVYTLGPWSANVLDDHGAEWIVEVEDGWSSSPPVRPTLEDKTAADGGWSGPGFYGPRVVNLAGRARAADRLGMLAAKDRLKAAINPRTAVTLTVAEAHLTRYATVRLSDQIDIKDQTDQIFAWSLSVVAADPRRYGTDTMTGVVGLPVGLADGRTYDKTYDYTYGVAAPSYLGSVWLHNAGDYDQTPATVVFAGPVLDPRVEHVQTGHFLQFTTTVEWGETLVIDLRTQTVMLNGETNRAYTITAGSAWFFLTPGVNELLFRGTTGSAPPGETAEPTMTVTAAPAWT